MNRTENSQIKVLLVEDNPGDVRLIRELLKEAVSTEFNVTPAGDLGEALERLGDSELDVILLDLNLPGSEGLETLAKVHNSAPQVPIVVLTGLADEVVGDEAVKRGAQDYLVKGQVEGLLLSKSLRYAIERSRLITELEQARQREIRERELRSLEQLSVAPQTSITAQMFNLAPLRASSPETVNELGQRYSELLDLALEQQAYKVEHNVPEGLNAIAEQLGFLKAGPRDVVELHSTALKGKTLEATPQKAQAYTDEGRLMVLRLMGYLVSFYRNYSTGTWKRIPVPENKIQRGDKHE
ncbi:MAG: response regulator [Candidatus Neomarinimicrobiota bacterium]